MIGASSGIPGFEGLDGQQLGKAGFLNSIMRFNRIRDVGSCQWRSCHSKVMAQTQNFSVPGQIL